MQTRRSRTACSVVVLCLLAAGCGARDDPSATADRPSDSTQTGPTGSAPASPPRDPGNDPSSSVPVPPSGTRIISADSDYGPMLYDDTGQPIYLFTAEPGERPACYDACAEDWPPVLTDGAPAGGAGVRSGLLGTIRRADGRTQVTYAGHPLYFYAHEGKYQVLCHDVEEYGGTWLVVRPDGTPASA